jgi:hypothetical protein
MKEGLLFGAQDGPAQMPTFETNTRIRRSPTVSTTYSAIDQPQDTRHGAGVSGEPWTTLGGPIRAGSEKAELPNPARNRFPSATRDRCSWMMYHTISSLIVKACTDSLTWSNAGLRALSPDTFLGLVQISPHDQRVPGYGRPNGIARTCSRTANTAVFYDIMSAYAQ